MLIKTASPHIYDLIVIGAGPAGMSAASAALDRGIRDVLLLDKASEIGGRLRFRMESAAGSRLYHKASGSAYVLKQFRDLLKTYEVPVRLGASVNSITYSDTDAYFTVTLSDASQGSASLLTRALILATGSIPGTSGTEEQTGALDDSTLSAEIPEAGSSIAASAAAKKEPGHIVPDSLSLDLSISVTESSYFFAAGDVTGDKALPDDACIEGAAAGRNAAELLLFRAEYPLP